MPPTLSVANGLNLDLNKQQGVGLSGTQKSGPKTPEADITPAQLTLPKEPLPAAPLDDPEPPPSPRALEEQPQRKTAAQRILKVLAMGSPDYAKNQALKSAAKLAERKASIDELKQRFDFVKQVSTNAKALRGESRQQFLAASLPGIEKLFPGASLQIQALVENPDEGIALAGIVQTPTIRALAQHGGAEAVMKFITSAAGVKAQQQAADAMFFDEGLRKVPVLKQWMQKNKPNEFARIMRGGLTPAEMHEINDLAPEGIRIPDEHMSNLLALRNRDRLTDLGVTIETSKEDTKNGVNVLLPSGQTRLSFDGGRTIQGENGPIPTPAGSRIVSTSLTGTLDTESKTFLTKAQIDKGKQQIDLMKRTKSELGAMIKQIEKDPSLVGFTGLVRRTGQTAKGVVSDITSLMPGLKAFNSDMNSLVEKEIAEGNFDQEIKDTFFDSETLSELRLFENGVGLVLARLRNPEGRVPVDIIKKSINDVKLVGLTSSTDVINRLNKVARELSDNIDDVSKRIGEPVKIQRFKTADDVVAAVRNREISRAEAIRIINENFPDALKETDADANR